MQDKSESLIKSLIKKVKEYPRFSKNEIEIYIENIKDRNFEFDVEVFNNYFSALKLVNDLS